MRATTRVSLEYCDHKQKLPTNLLFIFMIDYTEILFINQWDQINFLFVANVGFTMLPLFKD